VISSSYPHGRTAHLAMPEARHIFAAMPAARVTYGPA
jgi:hypothetical protein